MSEALKSWQWPTLISTDLLDGGPVITTNTSLSKASVLQLRNGNKNLCVEEGRTIARIELTPEAVLHLIRQLGGAP